MLVVLQNATVANWTSLVMRLELCQLLCLHAVVLQSAAAAELTGFVMPFGGDHLGQH